MRCDRFGNIATSMRLLAHRFYSVPADVALHSITREEPPFGLVHSPPVAQDFEELWGEHDIAIFLSLCVGRIYVAMASQLPAIKASSRYWLHISFAFPVADIPIVLMEVQPCLINFLSVPQRELVM